MSTAITTTGAVAVEANAGDPEVLVNIYGTYTGFAFAFEWSPDGTNGWAPLAGKDVGTGLPINGSVTPANSSSKGWRLPCDGIYVRMNVTAIASGTVNASFKSTRTSPQQAIVVAQAVSPAGIAVANTAVATVGAATLAAAAIVSGVITRTGSTAAYTDTTDTAVAILAAMTTPITGQTWLLTIKNNVGFTQTLASGVGVTLSGQVKIPGNSTATYLCTVASGTTVTMQCLTIAPNNPGTPSAFTALTTVGAGTITAAGIVGGGTNRSGPTAAFTDTTDTGTAISTALGNPAIGQTWEWTYANTTNFVGTLANGAGVTVTGLTVPPNTWARYLVTLTAANTITAVQIAAGPTGIRNAITNEIVAQAAPTAETGAATISIADILTGIVTLSHTVGATVALTLDTGTAMDTGRPATVGIDQAIDWSLINLSAAALDTGTLTAAATHTIVGNPIVQSAHVSTGGIYGNSARFRSRRTATNTWITYRIG